MRASHALRRGFGIRFSHLRMGVPTAVRRYLSPKSYPTYTKTKQDVHPFRETNGNHFAFVWRGTGVTKGRAKTKFLLHQGIRPSPLSQLKRMVAQQQQLTLVPPRRAKSISERGHAFRARERERVERLEQEVGALRRAVAEKKFLCGIWQAKYLRSRHTKYGSLARLVEEYYSIVRDGVHDNNTSRAVVRGSESCGVDPAEFLSRITHPEAVLGDVVGPAGMLDQWIKYTAAFSRYKTQVGDVNVCGPDEDPIVVAQLHVTVRFSRASFQVMFPHALRNETVAQQLLGREVSYRGTTSLRFSEDGQIVSQLVHFDFIEGFVAAGIALRDVEQLMRGANISVTCTIVEQRPETPPDVVQEWEF
jgi:hypothetical protein